MAACPESGATRMPAIFLGHGSPMNAIEHNACTDAWARLAATPSRPRMILAVSAGEHYELARRLHVLPDERVLIL